MGCSDSAADDAPVAATTDAAGEARGVTAATAAVDRQDDSAAGTSVPSTETSNTIGGESNSAGTTVVSTAVETTEPVVTVTTNPDVVTEGDLARFVAAAETAIDETSLAGVVFESPDIYIALAQASCARFGEGADFDTVAAELVAGLGSGPPGDVERLAGAILGAATRTICPEHADRI